MFLKFLRIVKVCLLAAGGAVVLFVCVGSSLWWMASSRPAQYVPVRLSPPEQDASMHELFYRIQEFGNQAGAGVPFTWSLTGEQINSYLASMDAIAALTDRPTHPSEQLKKLGLSSPAVALHKDYMTLMVHLDQYDRVASADVAVDYDRAGNVRAQALSLRLGLVAVPETLWAESWRKAQRDLAQRLAQNEPLDGGSTGASPLSGQGGVSVGKLSKMLSRILDMLQGQYVRPEITWPLGRHRVLIDEVQLEEGRITVHASPVNPARPASATSSLPNGGG